MLRFLGIVLLCIAAAIGYGLIHDQITIRIAPEYFTVLHPRILPDATPLTALALAWGVLATWWVGLILGLILGAACCLGSRPSLGARDIARPIGILLLVMAAGAILSGLIGHLLYRWGLIQPSEFLSESVPSSHIDGVLIDGFAHGASYLLGFLGGIVLAVRAWRRRGRLAKAA